MPAGGAVRRLLMKEEGCGSETEDEELTSNKGIENDLAGLTLLLSY